MDRARLERQGYSVDALRRMARRHLPGVVFDLCDGAANGIGDMSPGGIDRCRRRVR